MYKCKDTLEDMKQFRHLIILIVKIWNHVRGACQSLARASKIFFCENNVQ